MSPERVAELQARREALAVDLAELKRSGDRSSSCAEAVESTERLIATMDRLLALRKPPKTVRRSKRPFNLAQYDVIACWPNTPGSEVRLSIRTVGDTRLLDLRVWRLDAGAVAKPTIKGCVLDEAQFDSLLSAMTVTRNRLLGWP